MTDAASTHQNGQVQPSRGALRPSHQRTPPLPDPLDGRRGRRGARLVLALLHLHRWLCTASVLLVWTSGTRALQAAARGCVEVKVDGGGLDERVERVAAPLWCGVLEELRWAQVGQERNVLRIGLRYSTGRQKKSNDELCSRAPGMLCARQLPTAACKHGCKLQHTRKHAKKE